MKIAEDPALMERWDYSRNQGLDPERITTGNSRTKVYWKCVAHPHSTYSVPSYFTKTLKCAVCYGRQVWRGFNDFGTVNPTRATRWDYEKNSITPEEVTSSSNKKFWFLCEEGHSFDISLNSVASGRWCRYCARNTVVPGETDIFTKRPETRDIWDYDKNPDPETISVSTSKTLWWVCKEYGHSWDSTPHNLVGCPYCSGHRVLEGFNDFNTLVPHRAKYWDYDKNTGGPEEYTKSSGKSKWFICDKGDSFSMPLYAVNLGTWCPYCSGRKHRPGESMSDLFPEIAKEWSINNDVPATEIAKYSNKMGEWVCSTNPSHIWNAQVHSRTLAGTGCPDCNPPGSKVQYEIASWIRDEIPGHEVLEDVRRVLPGKLEMDIYIPYLGVAFEFHGLRWHSTLYRSQHDTEDKIKNAAEQGIDLYVIWEDDWRNREAIVKKWIKGLLGTREDRKINARACDTLEVSVEDSRAFLNDHHIQGDKGGSVRVGLYFEGTMVALAVFRRTGRTLSLERYATAENVRGGFTKLMTWVDRNIDYQTMETFADLTYSKGNLYESTGWVEVSRLPSDYTYHFKGNRVHKFNFRIDRFREDPEMTYENRLSERELAALNGLHRIYDGGKIKYTRTNPTLP